VCVHSQHWCCLFLKFGINAAVCSAAHLKSVERTCCFHYIGGCGHSRADVYERFRNILKDCAEKMILTYGKKCASDVCGVVYFFFTTDSCWVDYMLQFLGDSTHRGK